jgi:hypothetical protein
MDGSLSTRTTATTRFHPSRRALVLVTALGLALLGALAAVGATLLADESDRTSATPASTAAAGWRPMPPAPIAPDFVRAGVWTGHELLVFGREQRTATDVRGAGYATGSANVAAAYDPATETWRKLAPPAGNAGAVGRFAAAWTGTQLLVWGPTAKSGGGLAYDPRTNAWHVLPPAPAGGGLVAWTGRELVGWGGGCCGDASADGSAYDPATNTWRRLAHSPLAGSQQPLGAWTGRELIVLVSGRDPDGKPSAPGLARAAAYDPARDTWRRIAPPPEPREGAAAVWDGHELLIVGGSAPSSAGRAPARDGLAYDPATNRWRSLASMPDGRTSPLAAWTGKRLPVWGGLTAQGATAARGLAYDPAGDRWSVLPAAPLPARLDSTATWTGRSLLVWGGVPTKDWGHYRAVGASFTPARAPDTRGDGQ